MSYNAPVSYRTGTPDDLEPIVAIAREIWHMGANKAMEDRHGLIAGKPWQDHVADSVRSATKKRLGAGTCIVAEVEGRLIGWGTWWPDEDTGVGTIGYNGVHPDFRGRGIGTELVRRCLDALKATGMSIAAVSPGLNEGHAAARAVYEKLGFQALSRSVYYTMEL
jgi:GNAT superfamily N-acetyltransferase